NINEILKKAPGKLTVDRTADHVPVAQAGRLKPAHVLLMFIVAVSATFSIGVFMSLQIASNTSAIAQTPSASAWQQRRQDFTQLAQALQSGDLDAAKKAYTTLTTDFPNITSNQNSPLSKVGQALQSGDVATAQKAFASIHGGHHHHHSQSSTQDPATTTSAVSTTTSGAVGSLINSVD
ncbi:MAG: hypothetical protein ABUL58_02630, partial [Steroidobacter sp.]